MPAPECQSQCQTRFNHRLRSYLVAGIVFWMLSPLVLLAEEVPATAQTHAESSAELANDVEETLSEWQSRVSALESRIVALGGTNAELESKLAGLERANAELESTRAGLEGANVELESTRAVLESANAELESTRAVLESELTEARTENLAMRETQATSQERLQAELAQMQVAASAYDAELAILNSRLDAMQLDLETAVAAATELQGNLEAQRRAAEEAQAELASQRQATEEAQAELAARVRAEENSQSEMRNELEQALSELAAMRSLVPANEGGAMDAEAIRAIAAENAAALRSAHRALRPGTRSEAEQLAAIEQAAQALERQQSLLTRVEGGTLYRVRQGETLGVIAARFYPGGNPWGRVNQIFEMNRHVLTSPDQVSPGTTLILPKN